MKGIVLNVLTLAAAVVIMILIIILAYYYMTPVAFFFITGLCVLFSYYLLQLFWHKTDTNGKIPEKHKLFGALFLVILFGLSLFILRDYQLPGGKNPYFTNIEHHAIENYAIGFSGNIDLYGDETDAAHGIWPSRTGRFSIQVSDTGKAIFSFRNFYKPVFGKNRNSGTYLLNPLLETPLSEGFTVYDSVTTLRFTNLEVKKLPGKTRVSCQLIFNTSDYFLTLDKEKDAVFCDTLSLVNTEISEVADFRNLLRKSPQFRKIYTAEVIGRWLNRYGNIYLVPQTVASGKTIIHFFPQEDFFAGCMVLVDGTLQRPRKSFNFQFDTRDRFFVGADNRDRMFYLRQPVDAEKIGGGKNLRILELEEFARHPLSASVNNGRLPGTTELRFLKNSYQQLGLSEIREGFIFHEDVKNNEFTEIDGLIQYTAAATGQPVDYKAIGVIAGQGKKNGKQFFGIYSKNRQVIWFFSLEDFSKNPFDFKCGRYYLALLILVMCILVIFFPGRNLHFIEIPILLIIYMLMVFRLLLLWRVATFPPLKNINEREFDYLRLYDMKFEGISLPLPFSFLAVTGFLLLIVLIRWLRRRKQQPQQLVFSRFQIIGRMKSAFSGLWIVQRAMSLNNKLLQWSGLLKRPVVLHVLRLVLIHLAVLTACFIVSVRYNNGIAERFCNILFPLASYLYLSYRQLQLEEKFEFYTDRLCRSQFYKALSAFFAYLFENPGSVLSAITLLYFLLRDTGFGILFLFFLLLKKVLLSAFRAPAQNVRYTVLQRVLRPSGYWGYSILALALFLIIIAYKKFFYQLLEHKWFVLSVAILMLALAAALIMKRGIARVVVLLACAGILIAAFIPQVRAYANGKVEAKIRNVKYRTSILTDSLESILFNYSYNSAQERKIIETAQGQWFINSYLNLPSGTGSPTSDRKIRLREHFNKGVDYTTQTRDVLLPRFVIAEFGGLVMICLLILFFVPVVLFLMSYRISKEKENGAALLSGGVLPAMALLLLFIISLFVWLTSTNRFVFFGQDYPFLSLTSRLSTILPMLLLGTVLLCSPQIRVKVKTFFKIYLVRWFLFTVVLTAVILIYGRSSQVSEEKFKINFTRMESRIDTINDIFGDIQSVPGEKKILTVSDFRKRPEVFLVNAKKLLMRLDEDEQYSLVYNNATIYEKSILNRLKENPGMGFESGSPIHLKFDVQERRLLIAFNKYWGLELPNYNIKEVWQGDIAEGTFGDTVQQHLPVMHELDEGVRVIVLPAGYLKPGSKAIGLLFPVDGGLGKNGNCLIFGKDKNISIPWSSTNPTAPLNENDVVLITGKKNSSYVSWVMRERNRQYFAYSYLINGVQKHVYPLGEKLYWARHWTKASKTFYESQQQINENTELSLDYELTRQVNGLLLSRLPAYKNRLSDLTFSVIGADGNGNIRVMGDYAATRETIDPNDDYRIAKKEKDQYFKVDINAERIQWGNQNLLRMPLGPGSSLKPIVACAVTSQLKAEWQDLYYQPRPLTTLPGKEEPVISHYAGLDLKRENWTVKSSNSLTDFRKYLSSSNNLYHSLLMFLGSYPKDRFLVSGSQSLKHVLTQSDYGPGIPVFPAMTIGGSDPYYFKPVGDGWPVTNTVRPANGRITYFGNPVSLLANGLKTNFELFVNPSDRKGHVEGKSPISQVLPEVVLNKATWASPESSHFLQYLRKADDPVENFNRGFRGPALGGSPIAVTPLKMLEMYGKMATFKPRYRGSVDFPTADSSPWNYDTAWGQLTSYQEFVRNNIFQAMENAMVSGTAAPLTGGKHQYGEKGYYLYAKTGTIDDNEGDNSKRLILIISQRPLQEDNLYTNKVYLLYFTINNAYGVGDKDTSWFWQFYRDILDQVLQSESFKKYMSN